MSLNRNKTYLKSLNITAAFLAAVMFVLFPACSGNNKNLAEAISENDTLPSMKSLGVTTLISDKSRVYKGGSWADGAYYLSPSVRRFYNEDESSSTVGFRCAMSMIGSSLAK